MDHHPIEYTVDGERQESVQHELTADEILRRAGLDSATHYLVLIHGQRQESFEGKGTQTIKLHPHEKFISVSTGPTPVSDVQATGVAAFVAGLQAMGYEVRDLGEGKVAFNYLVEVGRFSGQRFEQGFVVPGDFPLNPPGGPHVSPEIHPRGLNAPHPTGNVNPSPFGDTWQYWSRPHPNWQGTRRRVADYMAHIRHLWATQ